MLRIVDIKSHERGLLFERGDFTGVLSPGRHILAGLGKRVEIVDTLKTRLEHALLEVLIKNADLQLATSSGRRSTRASRSPTWPVRKSSPPTRSRCA